MDVPREILEELKCSSCEIYLSRGPVYMQHDGKEVCNGCNIPKNEANRNKSYEIVAKLLKFPCKYEDFGCTTTVPFTEEHKENVHEQTCEFRQYLCPVTESGKCEWLGPRSEILQHCEMKHRDKIVPNPTYLTHDITKSNSQTYLLVSFNKLFLLYTKVSVPACKIFHCVRFLGDPRIAETFSFTLDVVRDSFRLTIPGKVAPQGCLAIQEDSSVVVNTNSLLDVLRGFDKTKFTITVASCEASANNNTITTGNKPMNMQSVVEPSVGNNSSLKFCENFNCYYEDTHRKYQKHKKFFCPSVKECKICSIALPPLSLDSHYTVVHADITHQNGLKWQVKRSGWRWCIIESKAICRIRLTSSTFEMAVWSIYRSSTLRSTNCTLNLSTAPTGTGFHQNYNLDTLFDDWADWRVKILESEFPCWNETLYVSVNITC